MFPLIFNRDLHWTDVIFGGGWIYDSKGTVEMNKYIFDGLTVIYTIKDVGPFACS
jgi:hypothetical protein